MNQSFDENQRNFKTSCTLEDAAFYLLGYSQQQVQTKWFENPNVPSGNSDGYYDLYEEIQEEYELAHSEYAEAKADNFSAEIIASKLVALDCAKDALEKVKTYKHLMTDELAKEDSALRVDRHFNENKKDPHITLLSLKVWAKSKLGLEILKELTLPEQSQLTVKAKPTVKVYIGDKRRAAILDEIIKLGLDPKSLPTNLTGKSGIKAEIRQTLLERKIMFDKNTLLFKDKDYFDRAWQSLLNKKKISNK